jgi:predicted signal transduction protein with EAL and GGDEF domain
VLNTLPGKKTASRRRILCVDDESKILKGLSLTLGREYEVETATSGRAALEILREMPETAVIISDMRMPVMNGAQFLAASRQVAPDARRILLTGHADTASAILAVNEGGIFRFLTKPCAATTLLGAVEAAIADFDIDVGERSAIRRNVTRDLLSHDALTGLASRQNLLEQLDRCQEANLAANPRARVVFVIEMADVEELSGGYDSKTAHRLIQLLSARLQTAIPDSICLARYREATFVALMVDSDASDQALESFATDIVAILEPPVDVDGVRVQIRARVGIARIPAHAGNPRSSLRHAELAAREAGSHGDNPVQLFSQDSIVKDERKRETVQALRVAVAQQQLSLYYQPIIDTEFNRVYSVEALARWEHAQLGFVSPATFIPLAEANGLMIPLGDWVLNRASAEGRGLGLLGTAFRRVSVNVSVIQVLDSRFMTRLCHAIETSGIDPAALELELTESIFAADLDRVCKLLYEARRLGVRVAIDDFGAGYSSLAYLARLPVDILKIDGSFVRNFDSGGEAIIEAALGMAHTLKIEVIVEGIETASELARIQALGATKFQGYHFARPMPAKDLASWYETFANRRKAVNA